MYKIIGKNKFGNSNLVSLLHKSLDKLKTVLREYYPYIITLFKKRVKRQTHFFFDVFFFRKVIKYQYNLLVEECLNSALRCHNNREVWSRPIIDCNINLLQLVIKK